MISSSIHSLTIRKFTGSTSREERDMLAVEEPLEIQLEYGPAARRTTKSLSVTMRTPGADADLVTGFLFTEGLVRQPADILAVDQVGENQAQATLHPDLDFDMQRLDRHFYTTSSCGVCGKTSIEAVKTTLPCPTPDRASWPVEPEVIYSLPERLRRAQDTFEATGGLHAAAFFSRDGALLAVREDVGRHNALDKLIGHCFQTQPFPLDNCILLLSGRASFELLQKAAMAGVRMVCAVGAPSSLAVETAAACGITLIGFLRDNRFNLYEGSVGVRECRSVGGTG